MSADHQPSDPLLEALLREPDGVRRDARLHELLTEQAEPLIASMLGSSRLSSGFAAEDLEDVRGGVRLRLLQKLRRLPDPDETPIGNFADFVASMVFHGIDDLLRRRYPQRALLKNRLRYLVTHDRRFALWSSGRELVCGPAAARDSAPLRGRPSLGRANATAIMLDDKRPAEAVAAIFAAVRGALTLDDLTTLLSELWQITSAREVSVDPDATLSRRADHRPQPDAAAESRQSLRLLWSEVAELRVTQRQALLLNLRDGHGRSALPLIVFTGTANTDDVANVLGMEPRELQALWNDLPLEDLRIAELLGITRQQVINLRKSARERLERRRRNRGF